MMWVECPVRGKFQMNVTDDLSLVQGVVCSDSIGGLPFFSWTPNRQKKSSLVWTEDVGRQRTAQLPACVVVWVTVNGEARLCQPV